MEIKRPRGRPRKHPLPDPAVAMLQATPTPTEGEPILLSIGVERQGKLWSAFLLKSQGDKVIERISKQPDLKISAVSALDKLYQAMLESLFQGV